MSLYDVGKWTHSGLSLPYFSLTGVYKLVNIPDVTRLIRIVLLFAFVEQIYEVTCLKSLQIYSLLILKYLYLQLIATIPSMSLDPDVSLISKYKQSVVRRIYHF